MKRILFVCTGNTCRSPMAEAMLRQMAHQRGITVAVRSAGVSTVNGLPVSGNAVVALRKRDISHTGSSSVLTEEAVGWADLVLAMTTGHKRDLLHLYPSAVDKTFTLKEFVNQNEGVLADIAELEGLYSDMQMKGALGEQLSREERQRLLELEKRIPGFDIADPFGGSPAVYDKCSDEIESALHKLLELLEAKSS